MINNVLNCILVETNKRDRAFYLSQGDIFESDASLILLNRYANTEGQLVQQLKQRYGEVREQTFYYGENQMTISFAFTQCDKTFLIVDTLLHEYAPITSSQYEMIIQHIFMALSALENLGHRFRRLALPVFYRNGIEQNYHQAVQILVTQATKWLKTAQHTHAIEYVLLHEKDAAMWSMKFNEVLGRQVLTVEGEPELDLFRRKVYALLARIVHSDPIYEDTITPLLMVLNQPVIQIDVLAAFSRKLLEVYCMNLLEQYGQSFTNLDNALQALKRYKLVSGATLQNFYQLKAYGNTAIHRLHTTDTKQLGIKDVTILLICLYELLTLYVQHVNE